MGSVDAIGTTRDELNRLRGRLFEIVEACGFPPQQCEAAKRLIRRSTYDAQAHVEAALRQSTQGH